MRTSCQEVVPCVTHTSRIEKRKDRGGSWCDIEQNAIFVGCCAGDTELFVWVKVKLPGKSAECTEKRRKVARFPLKNRRLFPP